MFTCLTLGDGVGGRGGEGGGGGVGEAKRVGEGRIERLFRIHELAHRSLWSP